MSLLRVRDLRVHYPVRRGLLGRKSATLKALDGVSFDLAAGRTLGIVGESGCGKSTLARAIMQLADHAQGQVELDGVDLTALGAKELRRVRGQMQMIFQDPLASLNPRMSVFESIAEPLRIHGLARGREALSARVGELMRKVGLEPEWMRRYPHTFSGGQCQRIAIARALALGPKLLVADEPVSALDVSIRAQIVELLRKLQHESNLACIFIAHDLALVRHFCDDVLVMYLGRVVERASVEQLFSAPAHPYTQALLAAVPDVDPRAARKRPRLALQGEVPSPLSPPPGCAFEPRCRHANSSCQTAMPDLLEQRLAHWVRCPPERVQAAAGASAEHAK